MLQLAMENTMDQWVEEFTRLRGEEEPYINGKMKCKETTDKIVREKKHAK